MPTIFETLAEGLDALAPGGEGWGAEHEKARLLADAAPALLQACLAASAYLVAPASEFSSNRKTAEDLIAAAITKATRPPHPFGTLFYIRDDGGAEPGALDLFVTAATLDAAIALWRAHYEVEPARNPYRVYTLPAAPTCGVVDWDTLRAFHTFP